MNTCGHCDRKIEHEPALFARGRLWHVNHLLCNVCGCRIQEEEKFEEKEGIIACRHCYLYGNNPKCAGDKDKRQELADNFSYIPFIIQQQIKKNLFPFCRM
ncbi:LIM domain protein [Ancylostoma caninum]|uniref:LIM domain protein n=1 Tax=Ancylostoma caninum TaxID=29170 RepID=A0A368G8U9_ANCCA|nr:LIM domain protein [Ancylostoma caninum]